MMVGCADMVKSVRESATYRRAREVGGASSRRTSEMPEEPGIWRPAAVLRGARGRTHALTQRSVSERADDAHRTEAEHRHYARGEHLSGRAVALVQTDDQERDPGGNAHAATDQADDSEIPLVIGLVVQGQDLVTHVHVDASAVRVQQFALLVNLVRLVARVARLHQVVRAHAGAGDADSKRRGRRDE